MGSAAVPVDVRDARLLCTSEGEDGAAVLRPTKFVSLSNASQLVHEAAAEPCRGASLHPPKVFDELSTGEPKLLTLLRGESRDLAQEGTVFLVSRHESSGIRRVLVRQRRQVRFELFVGVDDPGWVVERGTLALGFNDVGECDRTGLVEVRLARA